MSFDVVVRGWPGETVRSILADVVGAAAIRAEGDVTVLEAPDQSALAALLGQLNDLGIEVGDVRTTEGSP